MKLTLSFFILICFLNFAKCQIKADWSEDKNPQKWYKNAQEHLNRILNRKLNKNKAKNIILFMGDGKYILLFIYLNISLIINYIYFDSFFFYFLSRNGNLLI